MANYVSQVTLPSGASYNVRELFPHVGNCTDAAATAAKTVTIGNFKLYTGAWVVVKFSNTNSAAVASLTLNVDGTGAKPIKYRNANLSSAGLLIANRYTYFIYDGTNYQIVGDFDTNSDTYDRNRYKANIKAGTSALVAANIIVGKDGVFNHLKSGGSFDISYPILYLNGAVAAGETTNNSYDIINFTITTTQSISLTAYLPVFIKGTLSGKIFTPVSTTPLTQTVPTTDDGYQYMYLGNATSTSAVYLTERHPIYVFKNNAFGEIVHTASNVNGYTVGKSVPSDAVFTDTKVSQRLVTSTNSYYPILASAETASTTTETVTTTSIRNNSISINPSTGLINCFGRTIKGPAIQTGSSKVQHITFETLFTWLKDTKKYIPNNVNCHVVLATTWAYADNDILQINVSGTDYEIQLAGVIIEFMGNATAYNNGMFRFRIHTPPTMSFTPATGYTIFPVSHIVEYTCNGTAYAPIWKMILSKGDITAGTSNGQIKVSGTNITAYTHPSYTAKTNALYKITVDELGHVSGTASMTDNDASTLINLLTTGQASPGMDDYYISQYVDGGTEHTTFHRRPIGALWNTYKGYITTETTGTGNAITDASIADNGTYGRKISFTKGSTFSLSTHKHDSLYGVQSSSAVPVTTLADGQLKVFYNVNKDLTGNMPASNNANTIIQISKHHGNYDAQLGFSSNGSIYYRCCDNVVLSASVPWRRILDSSNTSFTQTLSSGTKIGTIKINGTSTDLYCETNTNTDRYVNTASFADDSTNTAASPVKMTLTRAGSDTATVTANIPKVSSSSAGVAPKGAAVSSQSQSTKFLREDGSWAAPTYTSIPSNNVTGSGTSGCLAKWNGTNTITNGPLIGSSTTTFLRNDGSWATPPDTKNTAGSTDTSSKIFLIGATSQAANPQTYSDNEVYTTSGVLTTKKVQVGGGSCTMEYNSTTQSLDFIFA